jgi:hypothetical protein
MLASGGRAQDKGPAAPATSTNYNTQVLKANELFNQDNQDSLAPALALVQAAIQSEPKRFEGYALEALIFAKQGRAQEAGQALATAQQLAPADKKERLTKVQAYVEAHAGAPPVASSAPSPEVQRKVNVLKLITDDADKAKSAQERHTLLNEFMDKSAEVLELAPLQTNIWVLRAVAAIELNQATAGRAAGRQLVRLGMDASGDPKIGKLMAQLDRKGWLVEKGPEVIAPEAPEPDSHFTSITLTPDVPHALATGDLKAIGEGKQNYVVFRVDTRAFANGGTLTIDIRLGDGASGGSFDLFPDNTPLPKTGRPLASLTGAYDVPPGKGAVLTYTFTEGRVFQFGATGNWFSPEDATNTFNIAVRMQRTGMHEQSH